MAGSVAARELLLGDPVLGVEEGGVFGVSGVGGECLEDGGLVAAAGAQQQHLPAPPGLLGDLHRPAAGGARRSPFVRVGGVAAVGGGMLGPQRVQELVDGAGELATAQHFGGGAGQFRVLLSGDFGQVDARHAAALLAGN